MIDIIITLRINLAETLCDLQIVEVTGKAERFNSYLLQGFKDKTICKN